MTATITVERDSLIHVFKTAAFMGVILRTQKAIHENHVYTDSPKISFDLVESTNTLDLLNDEVLTHLVTMIGADTAKSVFDKALKLHLDNRSGGLNQIIMAILDEIGEDDDA